MVKKMKRDVSNHKARFVYLDNIKFFMSLIIVIYHYNYFCRNHENPYMFKGGYLAVEVFFVISGFLFCLFEIDSKEMREKSIIHCMKHKVAGLFPAYAVSLIVSFGINIAPKIKDMNLKEFLKSCFWFAGDVLMIGEWGIPKIKPVYNIITWYISAMLLAFIFWLILFKIINKKYYLVMTTLITVLIYGYLAFYAGNLHVHGNRTHFLLMDGALRGIAGIGAGCLACRLYKQLKDVKSIYRQMTAWISFAGTVAVLFLAKDAVTDFIIIPLAIFMVAGASALTAENGQVVRMSAFMGKFSYFVYLNHLIVLNVMKYVLKEYSIFLYLCIVLLYSLVNMGLINLMKNKIKKK